MGFEVFFVCTDDPTENNALRRVKPDNLLLSIAYWKGKKIKEWINNTLGYQPKNIMVDSGMFTSFNKREYFLDLLFYHRNLRCLVAVDVRTQRFEAEFAGRMNFYLDLLNDSMRRDGENPSIGIVLCPQKDNFEVEYILNGYKNPMAVAEYHFTKETQYDIKESNFIIKRLAKLVNNQLGRMNLF